MQTKNAKASDRQIVDLVLALLRDANEDCKVDCGPMASSKIERAIRLLSQIKTRQQRQGARVLAGEREVRRNDHFRQVTYVPLGLSDSAKKR